MKGMPLNILCTRPLDEALVRLAAENNIHIDVWPFVRTQSLQDIELARSVAAMLETAAPVVFTSSNAVSATAALLKDNQPGNSIYCLSGATQRSVLHYWPQAKVAATAINAASLAEAILNERPAPGSVLFFCGDLHRPELPEALEQAGIDVRNFVVYRTELLQQKLEQTYDGVLFFSPSAVQCYLQDNRPAPGTVFFAIGATTAAALDLTGCPVVVAEEPEAASLVQCMIHYFLSPAFGAGEPNSI